MPKKKSKKNKRPSWDDYFLEVANAISKRATCDRGKAGSVIVKDKQILSAGYAGSPVGFPHCDEVGHKIEKVTDKNGKTSKHCVRTVHSEQNAVCQAAKNGVAIEGSTVYTRMTPCKTCAMLLINSGVKEVYCEKKYHRGEESEKMFKKAGIKLTYKHNEVEKYKNQ